VRWISAFAAAERNADEGEAFYMDTRSRWIGTGLLVAAVITGGGFSRRLSTSTVLAAGPTPTATPSTTATPGTSSPTATATPAKGSPTTTPTPGKGSPTATVTPGKAGKGSPTATATATPTGGAKSGKATATPTRNIPKKFVKNPTPIPARRTKLTLPAPIVLELATKQEGTGLAAAKAFAMANKYAPQLQISPPSFVPKNWVLQLIHVDPSQGAGAPPDSYLQYVPKGLKNAAGSYPSFYVTKQIGTAPVIVPGAKVQSVVINKGVGGAGVIMGTVADLKLKNGYEQIHVTWKILNVSYDVSSAVGLSKLKLKDLEAVAATVS
jgi:hypothetical protein